MSGVGVDLPVDIRARGRLALGRVYDLSAEGCLLGSAPGLIRAGTNVALRFACGMRVNGRVMLLHGSVGRVQFEQPLHEAVLAHLTGSGATGANGAPRRQSAAGYGRPVM